MTVRKWDDCPDCYFDDGRVPENCEECYCGSLFEPKEEAIEDEEGLLLSTDAPKVVRLLKIAA
jgi:hypothetical protein